MLAKYKLIHTVIIFIVLLLVSKTYIFVAFNDYFYDLFLFMNKVNEPQKEIVVVAIDSKSLIKMGRWPWDRKYHADLLNILFENGTKIAGFYITFYEPSNEESDNIFIKTLNKYPTVLISAGKIEGQLTKSPFWQAISKTSHLGHNFSSVDKNNITRRQFLFADDDPSFPLTIVKMLDVKKYNNFIKSYTGRGRGKISSQPINFKRVSSLFHRYSYVDVLEGNFPKDAFKNKIVLIAPTVKGIADFSVTPFTRQQKGLSEGYLSAVMLQAQILDSLLNFDMIKFADPRLIKVFLFIFLFLLINLLFKMGIFRQLVVSFIVLPAIILVFSLLTLQEFNLWISPVEFLLACLFSFVTVSVSVIATTSQFLDKYISELSGKSKEGLTYKPETSVDGKLLSLKDLTDIINEDKDLLETVLISVSSIIMLFDKKGNIIYSNSPDYDNSTFNISELSEQISLEEIKQVTSKNQIYKKRIELKQSNYNFIVSLAKGNFYVGILNDISDMVKINEMKTTLLRMLSHEFKTPLATILLCSDYITELNKNEQMEQYIEKIANQTVFLEEMIDNFLALSKLEVSDFQITRENIDISLLINSIVHDLKVISGKKNIAIICNFDPDIPSEMALDSKYILIALRNLIDNAIKYSPDNTEITVSITKEMDKVKIVIQDQGFGISAEDLKKLFEKFYRISNEKTKGIKGTGLGLSFVNRIIHLHGGDITINSQENVGSKFIITLPIVKV